MVSIWRNLDMELILQARIEEIGAACKPQEMITKAPEKTTGLHQAALVKADQVIQVARIAITPSQICGELGAFRGQVLITQNLKDEIIAKAADATKILDGWKANNHNRIRVRIQHLETELASALHTLRSRSKGSNNKEDPLTSSHDLETISDAVEFQENEFIKAQDRLRSIRANLAVLEGRMSLTIMDAQKILEEKQKRIDNASKSLQLLRNTCVVWSKAGSEVLLAGSFDGWTTQRKMQKSRTGIFSLSLMLYPGTYEIKFIVDGSWEIDLLRPIVRNNGYENNILIVS